MWPRLRNKEEDKQKKIIAKMVAGDDLCVACGWQAEIFSVLDGSNFCLECYYAAAKATTTTPSM